MNVDWTLHVRSLSISACLFVLCATLLIAYGTMLAKDESKEFVSPAICEYVDYEWDNRTTSVTVHVVSPQCNNSKVFVSHTYSTVRHCGNETRAQCYKETFPIGQRFNCTVFHPPLCSKWIYGTTDTRSDTDRNRERLMLAFILSVSGLATALVFTLLEIRDTQRQSAL